MFHITRFAATITTLLTTCAAQSLFEAESMTLVGSAEVASSSSASNSSFVAMLAESRLEGEVVGTEDAVLAVGGRTHDGSPLQVRIATSSGTVQHQVHFPDDGSWAEVVITETEVPPGETFTVTIFSTGRNDADYVSTDGCQEMSCMATNNDYSISASSTNPSNPNFYACGSNHFQSLSSGQFSASGSDYGDWGDTGSAVATTVGVAVITQSAKKLATRLLPPVVTAAVYVINAQGADYGVLESFSVAYANGSCIRGTATEKCKAKPCTLSVSMQWFLPSEANRFKGNCTFFYTTVGSGPTERKETKPGVEGQNRALLNLELAAACGGEQEGWVEWGGLWSAADYDLFWFKLKCANPCY